MISRCCATLSAIGCNVKSRLATQYTKLLHIETSCQEAPRYSIHQVITHYDIMSTSCQTPPCYSIHQGITHWDIMSKATSRHKTPSHYTCLHHVKRHLATQNTKALRIDTSCQTPPRYSIHHAQWLSNSFSRPNSMETWKQNEMTIQASDLKNAFSAKEPYD